MDRDLKMEFKAEGTYLLRSVSYVFYIYSFCLIGLVALGLVCGLLMGTLLKSLDSLAAFAGLGGLLFLTRGVYLVMAIAGVRTNGPDRANVVGMVAACITIAVCLAQLARGGFSVDLTTWAPVEWAKVILCSLYLIGLVKVRRHPVRQRIES